MPPLRKEAWIRFRVTHQQEKILKAAAEAENLTLSEWIRRLALARAAEVVQQS